MSAVLNSSLGGFLSRPHFSRNRRFRGPRIRTNERIRAREVRVVDAKGKQLGIFSRHEALKVARERQIDLVEVAENANPPVCRLVDFGKYQYEQAKKKKETKKNQHANRTKEVQLSVKIDPHDLQTKQNHAIDFLCADMKVKVTLRFRGRENAHKEVGFEVIENFMQNLAPWGHADAPTKKIGRGLIIMISPLPKNQRAPHPGHEKTDVHDESTDATEDHHEPEPKPKKALVEAVPADSGE
ncbi:MAG: Translation initiation factor IF-3 [Verrucomicrobia subdivision 3 bacterium]|nr:Translation initiation factor IF-3 [Limisphaerales bacterium]MCS1417105.1 Translation initiation factor IF-3 [Limisphaerales bacterium]